MKQTRLKDIKLPTASITCFKLGIGLLLMAMALPIILGALLFLVLLVVMLVA